MDDVNNPASKMLDKKFVAVHIQNWLKKNRQSPWAGKKQGVELELIEEQKKYVEEYAVKKDKKEKGSGDNKGEVAAENSTFHGKKEKYYQGRSWIAPPKDAKAKNDQCYMPKKWIHTWSGHTKGVSSIRFFLKQGHLLLSAGMDSKVKIWDVHNSGKCMRTYMGHGKSVRDISFSNDGTNIGIQKSGKVPYVVKQNPDDDKHNILLAGMHDMKIVQWDMNSGKLTQEYDPDYKSLRVWELGIHVVIKYISEPHMHLMPAIYLADNKILIYNTRERFQLNKKKIFAGHIYVMSGDGEGKCWFWNWKTCKSFTNSKCHEGVCNGVSGTRWNKEKD
ncbi:hypothetical protein MKX03_003542 [Papaver bracteatum]|nr:hypothetical protein MKX03_003542 [Papaver bracteatum]